MTNKEQLVERHILEYQSRLKHIAELAERAELAAIDFDAEHEARLELQKYQKELDLLRHKAGDIKNMSVEKWREETKQSAGPMAIWDILAQNLEDFVERHE